MQAPIDILSKNAPYTFINKSLDAIFDSFSWSLESAASLQLFNDGSLIDTTKMTHTAHSPSLTSSSIPPAQFQLSSLRPSSLYSTSRLNKASLAKMTSHQEQIDSLLQRYLLLLDEYTRLRTQLSTLQASVFRDIARANFSAERGLRYGQDQYDERMQAFRKVKADLNGELSVFEIEVKSSQRAEAEAEEEVDEKADAGTAEEDADDEKSEEKEKSKRAVKSRDPLRWFGLLTPQSLRAAQASSIEAVETVIPRLVTVNQEMAHVEIEVRRARKKRAKAEAATSTSTSTGAEPLNTATNGVASNDAITA
ncbi:hypothetical protein CC79DRAFT_170411 [Sarocladium strictum]